MPKNRDIADPKHQAVLFENLKIRRIWHDEQWYYSVVDVVGVLTDSKYQTARKYWNKLRERLKNEGFEQLVTICHRLKMIAEDGKSRETDCANTKGLLRIIQSIPSKKAEPFKQWLAKIGHERLQEMSDPAQAVDRAREYWKKHGRSEKWIQQRMMGQETRNKLTDYWREHEISDGKEFAILTNIIHHEWTGLSVKEHKDMKGLSIQNLRDHMSEEELIFTALAELSTRKIAETDNATGMAENKVSAKKGGQVAKNARLELEEQTGHKVVSDKNFLVKRVK
jgi:prophage antirepressor-like protein